MKKIGGKSVVAEDESLPVGWSVKCWLEKLKI